jgi:hypothetical protein
LFLGVEGEDLQLPAAVVGGAGEAGEEVWGGAEVGGRLREVVGGDFVVMAQG